MHKLSLRKLLLAGVTAATFSASSLAMTPATSPAPEAAETPSASAQATYDWTQAWTNMFNAETWADGAGHAQPGMTEVGSS